MDLVPPIRGLHRGEADSAQPTGTAQEAVNVRGDDCVTGRERLSQRAGMSPYCAVRVGEAASMNPADATKIDRLVTTVVDSRRIAYEPLTAANVETEWAVDLDGSRQALAGVVDRQDNLIVMDGDRTVVKFNSKGRKVYSLPLPILEDAQKVRALDVDDNGNLFVGVSEGGSQSNARVWRFQAKKGSRVPQLVWTYTPGGFVERIRIRGDALYLAVNQKDRHGAKIVQLHGALTAGPTVGWESKASYPVNDMALKDNGDVIFCSPPFATRGIDPRSPQFSEKTEDWKISQLANYEHRVWADYDADRIQGIEDGQGIGVWLDTSGNGRHLVQGTESSNTTPIYRANGINGLPSVYFRGKRTYFGQSPQTLASRNDLLQSSDNASVDAASADQQLTSVPGYYAAQWVMFLLVRPKLDVGQIVRNQCILSLPLVDDTASSPRLYLQLWANRSNDLAGASGGTPTAGAEIGSLSVVLQTKQDFDGASSGTASGQHLPIHARYTFAASGNDTGAMLVTLVITLKSDNGPDTTVDVDGTRPHCALRVNGHPIDRWITEDSVSPGPFFLGQQDPYNAATQEDRYVFEGDIARLLVFRDYQGALMTMPRYPRTVGKVPTTSAVVAWTAANDTELEKIEGALLHKYGMSHLMPSGYAAAYVAPTLTGYGYAGGYTDGYYPHPYQRRHGPPRADGTGYLSGGNVTYSTPYLLASPLGLVAKLDGSRGQLQWVATSANFVPGTSTTGLGGVGYAVAVSGNRIFCVGPASVGGTFPIGGHSGQIAHVCCIIDKNTTGEAGWSRAVVDGAWTSTGLSPVFAGLLQDWPEEHLRIEADRFGQLYVPGRPEGATQYALTVFAGAGDGAGTARIVLEVDNIAGDPVPRSAIPQRNIPAYRIGDKAGTDFPTSQNAPADYPRAELVYLCGPPASGQNAEVWQLRLVEAGASSGSAREIVALAFTGGHMRRFTTAGYTNPLGAGTLANPVYRTTTNYVSAVSAFGKVYFSDGTSYFVYDPKTDVVAPWVATDGGRIPPRCRLLELWNGRMVVARGYDDPHGWHMSEQGNPLGWDFFPVPRTSTMAVSAVSSLAGTVPDIVTCLIPYSDDTLIVGCDSSVWMMRGDPAANGVFDRVSDITGIAFGRAWCKDPDGVLYFFGSRGGVYRMVPGGVPQSMTEDVIDSELRSFDLAANYVEMVWNDFEEALHVFQFALGNPTVALRHFVWQRSVDGWFEDRYGTDDILGIQPTAVAVMDGDLASDRAVLLGTRDGFVRKLDPAAKNDGDTDNGARAFVVPIETSVKWGPLAPQDVEARHRFTMPRFILASDQDGVTARIYAGGDPRTGGRLIWEDELHPGRNRAKPMRAAGEHVWLALYGQHPYRRWSLDAASILATPIGRARERA